MESKVSTKNTKNEILTAYEELLKKVQEKKTEEPKQVQERQKQEAIVNKAERMSYEGIVKEVTTLKVNLSSELDKISDSLVSEFKIFEELQQATAIEKKNLNDLYQLSANSDSLSVMLLAQKEKREQFELEMTTLQADLTTKISAEKARFETEMAEKRLLWQKEQEVVLIKNKEEAEQTAKNRKREEEEYQYNLKLTRKKDADLYEEKQQKLSKELVEKKSAFEQEFAQRETAIKIAETELAELRKKNDAFPAELEIAVNAAIKNTTEKLENIFRFEKELQEKETTGELKLKDQTIETLKSKIKDIETSIKEMAQKAMTAEAGVKDIAIKAIESASSKPYIVEKQREQQTKE